MAMAGNRRERERERHRGEILDAAEGVFAEKGFGGGTVEDVAVRAEFSVGTLYNYFGKKDDLYYDMIETRWREVADELHRDMDTATTARDVMRLFVEGKYRVCRDYLPFAKIYTRERMGDRFSREGFFTERIEPIWDGIMRRLVQSYHDGVAAGEFRDDIEAEDAVMVLIGSTDELLFAALSEQDVEWLQGKAQVVMTLFFDGVRR